MKLNIYQCLFTTHWLVHKSLDNYGSVKSYHKQLTGSLLLTGYNCNAYENTAHFVLYIILIVSYMLKVLAFELQEYLIQKTRIHRIFRPVTITITMNTC